MEIEQLELLLKDQLREQEENNRMIKKLMNMVDDLNTQTAAFSERLENLHRSSSDSDYKSELEIIRNKIAELKSLYETSLSRTRENNFQVFLKSDAKKWLVILVVSCLFLTYLYFFSKSVL